jgi:hypothetical protein
VRRRKEGRNKAECVTRSQKSDVMTAISAKGVSVWKAGSSELRSRNARVALVQQGKREENMADGQN